MIKSSILLIVTALAAMPLILQADQKTVTLQVVGMSCITCPYQVQRALKRVNGVVSASASLDTKEAIVTFDDALTEIENLTQATANAGFPSRLKIHIQ